MMLQIVQKISYFFAISFGRFAAIWIECAAHWQARGDEEKYRQARMDLLRRTGLIGGE